MINVTCAVIRNEANEVLIVRKGVKTDNPFKWEFPGGKTDEGESEEECIIREVAEELSMNIVISGKLEPVEYDYGYKQIKLFPFISDTLEEMPLLSEHLAYKWISVENLLNVDFSAADILVAKQYIMVHGVKSQVEIEEKRRKEESDFDDRELQSMIIRMMSMKEAEWLANSAIDNPAIFLKLIEYSNKSESKLAFRASWTLTKVCDKYPEIIYPFLPEIVESIAGYKDESVLRSFLRIISLSELNKISSHHHGILADFCFSILYSGSSAIAVKAYSMEILYRLCLIYPAIANELSTVLKVIMEDASAGITSRSKIILKKLAKIPLDRKSSQ